ncbi:MAG: hypothetical protein HRT71_06105 [Flavobacteriales bacterium]|nr:hypothetical protein [Flavobacteriales bacterium]
MNYKLIIILFFAAFAPRQGHTQEYLNWGHDLINTMFEGREDSLSIKDQPNLLEILVDGNDKLVAKYFFDKNAKCDSIHINYYCSECVKQHMEEILGAKKEKWVKTDGNTYVLDQRISWDVGFSKNRMSTCKQLTIIKTPEQEICATMSFSKVKMETRIWRNKMKGK